MYQQHHQQQLPQSHPSQMPHQQMPVAPGQGQPFNNNLGTSGHRASSSINYLSNYNYDYPERTIPPTSTHYLPPPTQPLNSMIQPTMVGLVPPPPLHMQNAHLMSMNQNYAMQMAHQAQAHQQAQAQAQMQQYVQPQPQMAPPPPQVPPQGQPAVGGINPVLEYDLKTMATFLSWCAFGMLKQNRNPTGEFESLVNSVLFATRLPKSTIIIALEYMNQRFSSKKIEDLSESDIFIRLIVSLILGNKFNDDNTFTNRSWCGATGLQIDILNDEEKTWLKEVNWQLNVVNFEANIVTLEECWKTWLDKYNTNGSPMSFNSMAEEQSSPSSYTNQSIPSSPVTDYTYYSSPIKSSPKYQDSIWSNNYNSYQSLPPPFHHLPQQQQQAPPPPPPQQPNSIWSFTPNYQYNQPVQYLNSNFVGYANPYYSFNMASC